MRTKTKTLTLTLTQYANSIARANGFKRATTIKFADVSTACVGVTLRYGYRKLTTGQYVYNAYRKRFGWKNTYYQKASCEVLIPRSQMLQKQF